MSPRDPRIETDFLARMATASHRRLARALAKRSERELVLQVKELPRPPAVKLSSQGFDLIAEIKRRSPSAGRLAADSLDPVGQAQRYAAGGACALSVLTEPGEFSGELAHVTEIAAALPAVPVMRKDFLVGNYQILEARVAGAAGVLLIAGILEPEQLEAMTIYALELGLFALLEVFDEADVERCLPALDLKASRDQILIGVNCRDLRTLQVDFTRFATISRALPRSVPWVAESGIETPEQAAAVARLGYRVGLVGTALMRAGDPAASVRELLAAGRAAATRGR